MINLHLKKNIYIFFIFVMFLGASNFASAQSIQLNVPIPVPGGDLISEVEDLPNYVSSFFQFAIVFMAIILSATMVVGGGIYLAAAGFTQRVDFAKNLIKRAAFGLLTLLFAVVIINQVNPDLLDIKLDDVTQVDVGGSINPNLTCSDFINEAECTIDITRNCIWSDESQQCFEPRPETAGGCEAAANSQQCATFIGCVWEKACTAKDISSVLQSGTNTCAPLSYTQCINDANCIFKTEGTCINKEVAYQRSCDSFTNRDTCPDNCFWSNKTNKCTLVKTNDPCTGHYDCPFTHFCFSESKTCQLRLKGGDLCDGLGVGDDQRVCIDGYFCADTIFALTSGETNRCEPRN